MLLFGKGHRQKVWVWCNFTDSLSGGTRQTRNKQIQLQLGMKAWKGETMTGR